MTGVGIYDWRALLLNPAQPAGAGVAPHYSAERFLLGDLAVAMSAAAELALCDGWDPGSTARGSKSGEHSTSGYFDVPAKLSARAG